MPAGGYSYKDDRTYFLSHKEKRYEIQRKCQTKRREGVLTYYGNGTMACVLCGENNSDCLSIDHINGGGRKHIRETSSEGTGFYSWLIKNKYPEGFRTLCMNCQFKEYARMRREKRNAKAQLSSN